MDNILAYLLFYVVMFMRLIILESDRHALWIKIVGILLITVRFADWPYELAFVTIQQNIMYQQIQSGGTCWAQWGNGVIIVNFIGDALANLFLSGMFVRRLYLHIRLSKSVMSRQNRLIEYIARKSLLCLTLTFVVNLAMNLLKVTNFLGNRSDAFTVYFQIIESTLLVEALRVDYTRVPNQAFCENCGMAIHIDPASPLPSERKPKREQQQSFSLPTPVETEDSIMRAVSIFEATTSQPHIRNSILKDEEQREVSSAPVFGLNDRPVSPSKNRPVPPSPTAPTPAVTAETTSNNGRRRPLSQHPEWSNNDYRMF
ncbi:hypothetical protein BJV82DRAFT_373037 [Fennellomyces sp. T-0311]|nr:hypothetical protein BJV82DRAFT_373037 [Fennellomyces sp. T-0311]